MGDDLANVHVITAATAADDLEIWQSFKKLGILVAKLLRIARIKLGGLVQLGVALARRICADKPDTTGPCPIQFIHEMGRVRAIDPVEKRRT
jgi:hypothetical protein